MTIKIAGHTFGFDTSNPVTQKLCQDYVCDQEPEVTFAITDEELSAFNGQCRPSEREFYALHGKIAHWLMERDVLLFHGSCLDLDGNGILFTAASGTGKSTHARLWRERFGQRLRMINDDKPMLQYHPQTNQWTAWGSPWSGKESINSNSKTPLRCIVVLCQAPENTIVRLSPTEAAEQFLTQALLPEGDFMLRIKSLQLIDKLSRIPVYRLGCTISQDAVDLSYNALLDSAGSESKSPIGDPAKS